MYLFHRYKFTHIYTSSWCVGRDGDICRIEPNIALVRYLHMYVYVCLYIQIYIYVYLSIYIYMCVCMSGK